MRRRSAAFKDWDDRDTNVTTVVVPADPPFEGVVLQELVASTPLSQADAVRLYEATLADVAAAADKSGGTLLVNYRPREHLPEDIPETATPKTAVADVVDEAVADPESVRYEVQVGSSYAARVGNTVTHLLEEEEAGSVHVVDPTAALVSRKLIDSTSMKLRRTPIVVGPAPGSRVYYAGFTDPIDFEGAYDSPALQSLVGQALDDGFDVDFIEQQSPIRTASDLATVVSTVRARAAAGRITPEATLAAADELGIEVHGSDDGVEIRQA